MDNTLLALAIGAALLVLDYGLRHFHFLRVIFRNMVGMVPRWVFWLVFLGAAGTASHLASAAALFALLVAIATFGLAMLAWRASEFK